MRQKSGPLGFEYKLYAVKDDEDASKEVVLTKKHYTAYSKIFNRFSPTTRRIKQMLFLCSIIGKQNHF